MLGDEPLLDVVNETNRILEHALQKGIADNMPPEAMLNSLKNDVFLFSGLKTHKQLKEASSYLLDSNNKIRSYKDFKNDVLKLHKTYNSLYLEAEYDFAIASSQMAAKWADFEADGDRYNLQYRTAGDEKVRQSHAELNLTTLPLADPFWDSYLPPLGWRCRCNATQVRIGKYPESNSSDAIRNGEKATSQINKKGENALEIFRFNPGKDKVIFPPKHPYRKVQEKVKSIVESLYSDSKFTIFKEFKGGGSVNIHRFINRNATDFNDIVKSCEYYARNGNVVHIMPKLHVKSKEYQDLYKGLKGTKYWGKCPDFRIGNQYYEFEGWVKKDNALSNMFKRGVKQSNRLILKDTGDTENHIKKIINYRIKEGQVIDEVWILKDSGSMVKVL